MPASFTRQVDGSAPANIIDASHVNILQQWIEWGTHGVYNAIEYGADPTGAADSTTAINNAIAGAFAATPTKGMVLLPPGNYLVSGQLSIATAALGSAGVTLQGAGQNLTTITSTYNGAAIAAIHNHGTATDSYQGPTLRGFFLNGNNGAAQHGVWLENVSFSILDDLFIAGFSAGDGLALDESGSNGFTEQTTVRTTVHIQSCLNCIHFRSGGANEYSYTHLQNPAINVNYLTGETGIQVDAGVTIYNAELHANMHSATGNTIANIAGTVHYCSIELLSEGAGSFTVPSGGTLSGWGHVSGNIAVTGAGTIDIKPEPLTQQLGTPLALPVLFQVWSTPPYGSFNTYLFGGIPQTYRHLRLYWRIRGDQAAAVTAVQVQLGTSPTATDTAADYDWLQTATIGVTNQTPVETYADTGFSAGNGAGASAASAQLGAGFVDILNYTDASSPKQIICECTVKTGTVAGDLYTYHSVGHWRLTGAVQSVSVGLRSGNIVSSVGCQAALYLLP
mgnify:CR=1 FL=1